MGTRLYEFGLPEATLLFQMTYMTTTVRPLELTEAQRQRIAENKRRAEELRAKRDAFLNRLDVQPDKEDASKQRQFIEETSATQHSVPQQPSQTATEPSTSAVTDMMDDDDALNFIFSTD
ncbi:hypothetical protein Tcan_07620 [Toxocara canis]|uniref:Uncharacterized protein n=1 Tax=Toxocara canis TaxID=6265 RepID=A0A0B2V5K9_TOXCA|nr:hypothetical protein Tcan_07620 [Toxocara canis]